MDFLVITDFDSHIRSEDLDKIVNSDLTILDDAELFAIERIKSEIESRFDVAVMFAATGLDRPNMVVNFAVRMVLYEIYSRINPRNIPDLIQIRYDDALETLARINSQELNPSSFPLLLDADGESKNFQVIKSQTKQNYRY
mgnify:FL=1